MSVFEVLEAALAEQAAPGSAESAGPLRPVALLVLPFVVLPAVPLDAAPPAVPPAALPAWLALPSARPAAVRHAWPVAPATALFVVTCLVVLVLPLEPPQHAALQQGALATLQMLFQNSWGTGCAEDKNCCTIPVSQVSPS